MKIKVGTRVQIFQDGEIIRERAVRQHASDLVATMVGAVLLVAEA